jgi:hypothetical protein
MKDEKLIQIHWSLKSTTLKNEDYFEAYSKTGEKLTQELLKISSAPTYLFILKESPLKVNCL